MAELKISAQELTEFKGFYYDHRLTLTVEGVNEENFEQVREKLKDICGDNIYCGKEKCEKYIKGTNVLTVPPLDLIKKERYPLLFL